MPDWESIVKGMKKQESSEQYAPFKVWEISGDFVKGKVSDRREFESKFGPTRAVTITEPDGTSHSVILTVQLSALWELPENTEVAVRYEGITPKKGGKGYLKNFSVYVM